MAKNKKRGRGRPALKEAAIVRAPPPAPTRKPRKEMITIHTTKELERNAAGGALGKPNRLAQIAGAASGGAGTLLVSSKLGLAPMTAGVVTGGAALIGSALIPKTSPGLRDFAHGATLGAVGVASVQALGAYLGKKHAEDATKHEQTKDAKKRQADADGRYITRDELNEALATIADKSAAQQKQASCDLLTALREEIRRAVNEARPSAPRPTAFAFPQASRGHAPQERGAYVDEQIAPDERDAYVEEQIAPEERDAYVDEQAPPEERDADAEEDAAA